MSAQVNTDLALHILTFLHQSGVEEICLCPGSRNAPWVAALSANPDLFRTYSFFEERCASFFALGRIQTTGRPVAVVTTSGTAVGELLPATMEAHYSRLPLILVTADRPRAYRQSGAPQTAEQVGIFGVYAEGTFDLEGGERILIPHLSQPTRPFHINACFDEPLLEVVSGGIASPYRISLNAGAFRTGISSASLQTNLKFELEPEQKKKIESFLEKVKRPAAIVGMLPSSSRQAVVELLLRWGVPTYFEGISGLREINGLESIRLHGSDRLYERAAKSDYRIDGWIRVGGIPTLRLWRDLEGKFADLPVLSLSAQPFSGLGRTSHLIHGHLESICSAIQGLLNARNVSVPTHETNRFLELDCVWKNQMEELLLEEPTSEPGMLSLLSHRIPDAAQIYLGNSLPIREWDLAATRRDGSLNVWASRGLNGIDGQVSTFLGFARPHAENWAIFGDLTALYDLPGPWILSQLPEVRVNLVVINNGGGKIFSKLYPDRPEFQNQHQIRFQAWAELWGLKYQSHSEVPPQFISSNESRESRLIELFPNEEATSRFWKKYQLIS